MCDINGDGCDDLVIVTRITGPTRMSRLTCISVRPKADEQVQAGAACAKLYIRGGDFNGDGRLSLLLHQPEVEVFYQDERGLVAGNYEDMDIDAADICAGMLTGTDSRTCMQRCRMER